MSYGTRLKQIKKELKLTTEQMSAALNIPARTFGSYERDESKIPIDFLTKLCKTYNINPNWFCFESGKMFETQTPKELDEAQNEALNKLLKNPAGLNMVLRFIEVKNGNKKALDELILNLEGVKAYLG